MRPKILFRPPLRRLRADPMREPLVKAQEINHLRSNPPKDPPQIQPTKPRLSTRGATQPESLLKSNHPVSPSSTRKRIRIRRWAAIGDVIAATSVARKLYEQGYDVHLETFSHCADAVLHSPFIRSVSERGGCDVNLDFAYENHPQKSTRHIAEIFLESSNAQLNKYGINLGSANNFSPILVVTPSEREWAQGIMSKYPHPWTVVCPRSHMEARSVPSHVIGAIVNRVPGTVFWGSVANAPEKMVDLQVRAIRNLMAFISQSDLVVSVDSAPMHISAGLKKPTLAIRQSFDPSLRISNQRDVTTFQRMDLPCLPCAEYVCRIDKDSPPCGILSPEELSAAINSKLNGIFGQTVSAIIPIYRTNVERLNRCLNAILPQVDEVVIGIDGDGITPIGVMSSKKIKFVRHKVPGQYGYGHTCNLASRESSGRYLLMLNDDCFAGSGMVETMKRSITNPGVAVVGGLLRYPNGLIQHGGTRFRGNNFEHMDHGITVPSIRKPIEVGFVTFAAALVSRSVFFDIEGFDERYHCYYEDSDFCLRVIGSGRKVIYSPEATAVHEVSQTTSSFAHQLSKHGESVFNSIWGSKFKSLQEKYDIR